MFTSLKSFTSVPDTSFPQLKIEQIATFAQSLSIGMEWEEGGNTSVLFSDVYLAKITFNTFCPLRDSQRKADEKVLSELHGIMS